MSEQEIKAARFEAEEIAVIAVDPLNMAAAYGRELIDRVIAAAGVTPDPAVLPKAWLHFHCGDYFASPLAINGYFDELGQYEYIRPTKRVYEDTDNQLLVVGGPGVDGIDWGYRRDIHGLWAFDPMAGELQYLAKTVSDLLDGWLSGTIVIQ